MKLSYRNERTAKFIASYYSKPLDKPDWYSINAVSDDEAEILLYDYIGWPYNEAGDFVRALGELRQGKIVIRINSPGGDVFDAHAIHNAIKAHPSKPTTRIESLAASAASYISIAGSERQAYKNTMAMIHEPMTGMWGNQYELREVADILEQISGSMIEMYADNTNVGKRELKDMLKVETWMNAKAMKEKGFIDTIIEAGKPVKAQFDLSMFANIPEGLSNGANEEATEREKEKALRDVGFSQKEAKAILAGRKEGTQRDVEGIQAGIDNAAAQLNKNITILGGQNNDT